MYKCISLLRGLAIFLGVLIASPAQADTAANRLENLHHAVTSVAHAMSTSQMLGHALAKRVIGRTENQFQRDLNTAEKLAGIAFGEARWRLQAIDATAKLEELGHSERLFGILLEAARQWNGTAEDAFEIIDAVGVLDSQLERLSVSIGRMSDEQLATLLQRTPNVAKTNVGPPRAAVSIVPADEVSPSQPRSAARRADDQNL
jgi:hypothetical protein